MKKKTLLIYFFLSTIFSSNRLFSEIPQPVLKWKNGGYNYKQYYNRTYYTSAAVMDVNNDGIKDIIFANSFVFAFDGKTGTPLWEFWAGTDMSDPDNRLPDIYTHCSVIVADINGDEEDEIVTAHTNGYICAYDKSGYFLPGFPTRPEDPIQGQEKTDQIESLSVYDLDNNGDLEIIIGWGYPNQVNTCVLEHDGTVRSGWPQYTHEIPDNGNARGIFNANIAVGDMDKDGYGEIISPSDTNKICAYKRDGSLYPANSTVFTLHPTQYWATVSNYLDYADEKAGFYATADFYMCTEQPAVIVDVNNDGIFEVVIIVQVFKNEIDPVSGDYINKFLMPLIFNTDRTRFNQSGYNWEENLPRTQTILSNDMDVIMIKTSNPVVVDLDGDGEKEILTSNYDGQIHCYWLDKTEHHSWPFSVYDQNEGIIRYSTEPAVVDLDGDGAMEVIFSTWTEYQSNERGHLFILNHRGELIQKVELPYGDDGLVPDTNKGNFDGSAAAPTISDVDGDGEPEIIVPTVYAGLCVYDLPGLTMGQSLWNTGRGNYQRNAFVPLVNITYPHEASNLRVNNSYNIRWNGSNSITNVKIELLKGGSVLETIASSTSNDGLESWTPSNSLLTGHDYQIKISDASMTSSSGSYPAASMTSNPFTITNSSVTITSPTSSSEWLTTTSYDITWITAGSVSNVKVELLKGAVLHSTLYSSITNNNHISWTPPDSLPTGSDYQIRVSDVSNPAVSSTSDMFDIVNSLITITTPKASSVWQIGNPYNIEWTTQAKIEYIKIVLYQGKNYYSAIASSASNNGQRSWTPWPYLESRNDYRIKIMDSTDNSVYDFSDYFTITTSATSKDDLLATWSGQGVYCRNSDTGNWVYMANTATMITSGNFDNDDVDDLVGIWPSQNGVWVKYSSSGNWQRISSTADWIAAGDMNGDGIDDLLGTWTGQGVYYRDTRTGNWTKMATPATQIASGDLDGDGTDDLCGNWPSQGGVWVKYSSSGNWQRISSTADWVAAGDMNGDGFDDLLGTWTGQGVYYKDSQSGNWVKMATPATQIASGDLDGDGTDDLCGNWPSQGGVWVKYSSSWEWMRLSSTADWIACGRMRSSGSSAFQSVFANAKEKSSAKGPESVVYYALSHQGPGSRNFIFKKDKNLIPFEKNTKKSLKQPSPGEQGFRCIEQRNLIPHKKEKRKAKTKMSGKRS